MIAALPLDRDQSATSRLPRIRHNLLRRLMRAAPFQPATNLWRAVEIAELAQALSSTGSALDLGCGDGELTIILRDLVGAQWRLVGVDPDRSEAAAALATGAYQSVHAADAASVAEHDQSFDLVFANSVLEHIPNLSKCLREAARLLKPGGLLAATVPSPHFHRLLRGPGRFSRRSRAEYLAEIDRRLAHVNYWSAEQWCDELTSAGFEPPTFHGYLSRRQLQRWEAWSHWTGGLLYRLRRGRHQPIAIQRSLGLRRRAPVGFGGLASLIAWFMSYGVLDDNVAICEDAACWLVLARKNILVRSPKEQPIAERMP
ncbi:MAG TPA: class I SAM-dependent methyltransferase [Pirellulales bacterium]|nr:class I SAM-dependent methyltransferase [Pirellulales bacterium]